MPSEDVKAVKERLRAGLGEWRKYGGLVIFPGGADVRIADLRAILAHVDELEASPSPSAEREAIKPGDTITLCLSQDAEARVSALEGAARKMLWDGGGRPDHMTACERTMGDTHPCTCGAEAFRKSLGHSPSALSPFSPAPVKEEVKPGWRPIAEAPQTGVRIIATSPLWPEDRRVRVVWWVEQGPGHDEGRYWQDDADSEPDPTLWQPLNSSMLSTPPPPGARREEIARLEWSEAAPPCEDCRHDHVVATSPLGAFRIEWKSWKGEGDGHSLILNEEYLSSEYSLADAKEAAAEFLANKAAELAPFALKNEEGRGC